MLETPEPPSILAVRGTKIRTEILFGKGSLQLFERSTGISLDAGSLEFTHDFNAARKIEQPDFFNDWLRLTKLLY